jgi:H+/Cl- antiporter ClcA
MFDLKEKSDVYMNGETLKTLSLCSFFVFLFGVLGFLVAIILNAAIFYVETRTTDMYVALVQSEILAVTYIPYYLLTAVLFAVLGLLIIYRWKHSSST